MVSMRVFENIYLMHYALHVAIALIWGEKSRNASIGSFDEKSRRDGALQLSPSSSAT